MANQKVKQAKKEVAAELARINAQHGGLQASVVVAEAEPKDSPLHGEFEWDNKKAGHKYRLMQARTLIRLIVPVIELPDGSTRADPYVWVPPTAAQKEESDSNEGVYQTTSVVVQDTDAFARALSALTAKMTAAIRAAEELRDAAIALPGDDGERMARIAMAITALQTAGAAVQALH